MGTKLQCSFSHHTNSMIIDMTGFCAQELFKMHPQSVKRKLCSRYGSLPSLQRDMPDYWTEQSLYRFLCDVIPETVKFNSEYN